jgi:hypothetical protein
VGYDITFTLEADEEFIPVIPPLEIDPDEQDDYGNVAEDKTGNNGVRSLSKKHKSSDLNRMSTALHHQVQLPCK